MSLEEFKSFIESCFEEISDEMLKNMVSSMPNRLEKLKNRKGKWINY